MYVACDEAAIDHWS